MIVWLLLLLLAEPGAAFEPARPGYRFSFPVDHFRHEAFESEWWYYTGNLRAEDGREFGFELTFFRQARRPREETVSKWRIDDIYLAHLALSDLDGQRFLTSERLHRAGPGLAGADAARGRLWNGNWEVRWLHPENPRGGQHLRAVTETFAFDFQMTPRKPPVIHGREGISRKGPAEDEASHYISFTRLDVRGTLKIGEAALAVTGTAWMDHEFFSHRLGANLTGWDWLSLQLDDGSDLMIYRLRQNDGAASPFSSGTWVDLEGRASHIKPGSFTFEPLGAEWRSGRSGAIYPLRWRIAVPSLGIELNITTPYPEQEMYSQRGLSPTYWEGAIRAHGNRRGQPLAGAGYLEMTGYDKPIEMNRVGAAPSK